MNKVITLSDGVEVEVELQDGNLLEISNCNTVDSSITKITDLLTKVVEPVSDAYNSISEKVDIESVKVTVGVKFGVSGNVFVAKSSADASINVELTFKAK
ncbi:hypothetical protein CTM97_12195 [Photobacterium phosphoreum]|uniref:Trypsin-co-occurring domain-containing protein n=1 Tax=Photobacterium phosphoreum TaxID=659 RepID=A0A2T3JDM7_PHOPO|nr:CU044_2847 family protein [Photobacterium phosphoreum]PSU20666.1 hypothetical protein CTM96_19280 [Photobacterium phosphoreum]PSU41753.1 hypothetical protein CTM97_12195 [Photobacterium phosphoreum]PSU46968.1 hypothetical protein C9J18_19725 [Photobacterium phosphoreum]